MGDPILDGDIEVDGDVARERTDARLLRTLLDQLPALVAYWDAGGHNVVANHAYVDYFGLDPDQIRGLHISEVLGADVYLKNLPYITGVLEGTEQLFDRTLVDQSGRTRHVQASYVPDVVGGVVTGFFVLVTDVTPRVEAQRAMDEAQAIARLGSWELEVATGVVTWSRNLYEIVGLDPDDASPRTLPVRVVHLHPEDRDRALSNVEQAVRTGRAYTSSYRIITVDGGERDVVSRGRPVVDQSGRVTHVVGMMQDVTEANAAAREVARVNIELRRANELNADVIAMLGHDIRTPLGAVVMVLEDLEDSWTSYADAERRQQVARARAAADRLGALVERILALAAADGGGIHPRLEDVALADVLEDVVGRFGLPGAVLVEITDLAPRTVSFDRVHLEQVVVNLLTNAFRYGAEPVRVRLTGGADAAVLELTDAGDGVPREEVGALFTRFARTGGRQADVGGTGFGLYMAAQLAEANGATLSYRPAEDGRPHAFVLTIPVPGSEQVGS